jgi:hypothetical protein
VARVRQARRCHARRSDGQPCRAWAIVGGTVCRVHGGSTRRARYRAYVNRTEASIYRAFEVDYARWCREWAAWQTRRIAITASCSGYRLPTYSRSTSDAAEASTAGPTARRLSRRYAATGGTGPGCPAGTDQWARAYNSPELYNSEYERDADL